MNVKAIIDNNGVISAHNLHKAGLSELDNGNTADNIAHPRKKHIHYPDVQIFSPKDR